MNIKKKIGLDKPVSSILINKFWTYANYALNIIFLIKFLTPVDQGIWFTFLNLNALTVIAEMGFSNMISQLISHEFANLNIKDGKIDGKKKYLNSFFGLIRYALRFYVVVIPIAIIILITAGYFIFHNQNNIIFLIWTLYSITGGLRLMINIFQSLYQSMDKVSETQECILIGSISYFISIWISLYFGLGLFSLVIGNFVFIIVMSISLFRLMPGFWWQIFLHKSSEKFIFHKDFIHLQIKYAISWICGYFVFNLFIPFTYIYKGPVLAGQLGLTLNVIRGIMNSSCSWLEAKIPQFNILSSQNKEKELFDIYRQNEKYGLYFYLLGSTLFILFIIIINYYNFYNTRFLSPIVTLIFLFTEGAEVKIWLMAIYLRAHKFEPYYKISIIGTVLTFLVIIFILSNYKLEIFAISLFALKWLYGLPCALKIFNYNKKNYLKSY